MNEQDPIRNSLRDLIRAKVLWGWQAFPNTDGTTTWLVVPAEGRSGMYTTDEVNHLIAMYWVTTAHPSNVVLSND